LFTYARVLLRTIKKQELQIAEFSGENYQMQFAMGGSQSQFRDLIFARGVLLGALGGLAGLFLSGLVHYNWGDSEVIMIFYFTTGLSLVIHQLQSPSSNGKQS
jgi:hypothetical protein